MIPLSKTNKAIHALKVEDVTYVQRFTEEGIKRLEKGLDMFKRLSLLIPAEDFNEMMRMLDDHEDEALNMLHAINNRLNPKQIGDE